MHDQGRYIIGIDAGGTYTDAVIMDAASGTVIASAKRPTTHYDLSIGITAALHAIMDASQIAATSVGITSVSTTLATNALVEGKGAEVGLFVIGFNERLEVPAVAARFIPGGHTIKGEEQTPLGVEFILDGLKELHSQVDAWAVCGTMAFINPAHELITAKAIELTSDKPVFCSHEASMRAGMKERATTACLNAQLLPVMRDFLAGMQRALSSLGITGSVFVVRGDARAMHMEEALRHAASTVASGPAATALFGSHQAQQQDALIVDVGGTTTDITLVRAGKPVLDTEGMTIGKWETHVEAVEMFTVGVGGDSFVHPTLEGSFTVGPTRVLPLCMAENLPDPASWIGHGQNSRCILAAPAITAQDITDYDILRLLAEGGPATPAQIMRALSLAEITVEQRLAKLARLQKVIVAGFTPTDALHVLGRLQLGAQEHSLAAARALCAPLYQDAHHFSKAVLAASEGIIEETILRHVSRREVGNGLAAFLANRNKQSLITVDVALNVPMVGIGAAAHLLLPEVAKRLRTTITFPERHEVGNALGAALMARPLMESEKEAAASPE